VKLNEVTKPKVDWNKKSEEQQINLILTNPYSIQAIEDPTERVQLAAVDSDGYSIRFIKNPTEQVQLVAVERRGHRIKYITNPTPAAIKIALTDFDFIADDEVYDSEVRRLFANNAIMMKKWLRYGETMRSHR
jgi:hypothetical protein